MFKAVVSFASVVSVAALLAAPGAARGNILIQFTENTVTNQTTMAITGNVNTAPLGTGLQLLDGGPTTLTPSFALTCVPTAGAAITHFTADFWLPIGAIVPTQVGTYVGPDVFRLASNGAIDSLDLPANYVSGTNISCGGLFTGIFATIGLTPTTVVMNLPGSQTITVQFASVPAPGAAALLGMGGMLVGRRRR